MVSAMRWASMWPLVVAVVGVAVFAATYGMVREGASPIRLVLIPVVVGMASGWAFGLIGKEQAAMRGGVRAHVWSGLRLGLAPVAAFVVVFLLWRPVGVKGTPVPPDMQVWCLTAGSLFLAGLTQSMVRAARGRG